MFIKFLSLFFLLFIHYSYAVVLSTNCGKAFVDRSIDRQFIETLDRYFSAHQGILEQRDFKTIIKAFNGEGRGRKGTIQYLIDAGYLTPSIRNPLFYYILNRPSSEVVRLIEKEPNLLYEGTLLDLPPFFLIVFVGDKPAMVTSIEVDKALTNSRNPLDEVPLHYTIDPEMATGLLYYNAKPDVRDKKGRVALNNSRNPETVETILHYKADPTIRDRSGMSVTKYHEKFVRDQEIINLLIQAREAQKSMRIIQNNHRSAFMNGKSVEQMERIEVERKTAETRRIEEEKARRTAEARRMEEEARKVEARRREVREEVKRQAQVESQKKIEEQKNKLISKIAHEMATAMMKKVVVNLIVGRPLNDEMRASFNPLFKQMRVQPFETVIFQKEFEDQFEKDFGHTLEEIWRENANEHFVHKIEQRAEEAGKRIEAVVDDAENRLKDELRSNMHDLSIKAMNRTLRKVENQSMKLDRVTGRLEKITVMRNIWMEAIVGKFYLGLDNGTFIRLINPGE